MKRKKILKFIAELIKKPIVKFLVYVGGIFAVLALSGAFKDNQTVPKTFLKILTSEDTLSLFFAGLFSIGVAKVISLFDKYMEESLKTEDNHHKIISQYKGHELGEISYEESFADKKGVFFALTHTRAPKKPPKNAALEVKEEYRKNREKIRKQLLKHMHIKDKQSKDYIAYSERVENYLKGKLCLCSLNVFTNVAGDTDMVFEDRNQTHELSQFIIDHADEILQAHKNSVTRNSDTIRLYDFDYNESEKILTLNTERSTYYHMLITNRCMDYKFANGMSVRDTYEYSKVISPFVESGLGNQIGINGLVVTNDHHLLIEKRGHKKTTWKNKFAQSISLALKKDALFLNEDGTIENTVSCAEKNLRKIIENTLKDNFGLTPCDYDTFTIKENLLGLARDLLEGGKPNLYFYVKINCSAKELKEKLENNVTVTHQSNSELKKEERKPVIEKSKLESDYYLVKFSNVAIDFYYRLFLDRKKAYKVHRKLEPRYNRFTVLWDRFKEKCALTFRPILVRECGEALLVTIAFLELRWKWYQKKVLGIEEEAADE